MICCDPSYNLDIPDHYTSTTNYSATLAHKVNSLDGLETYSWFVWAQYMMIQILYTISYMMIQIWYMISFLMIQIWFVWSVILIQACHSFAPNSSFTNLYHPRFLINLMLLKYLKSTLYFIPLNLYHPRFSINLILLKYLNQTLCFLKYFNQPLCFGNISFCKLTLRFSGLVRLCQ